MSTLKRFFNLTFILLAMVAVFSSCEKDTEITDPKEPAANTPRSENFLANVSNGSGQGSVDAEGNCFSINYPISVNLPGVGVVEVNTEEELWTEIIDYMEAEIDDLESFPTIVYPILVTLENGNVQSVSSDEEICDLYHECYGDFGGGDFEPDTIIYNGDDLFEPCFDFVYPLTLDGPNNETITVNNEEEWAAFFDEHGEYEYFEMVFPIDVVLQDGTTESMNDEDEVEALFADCFGGEWEEPSDCDSTYVDDLCFSFVYPFGITLPDGTVYTAEDDVSLFTYIDDYYAQNPNSDDPTINYPISVIKEDGSQDVINNDEELEEHFEECYGDGFGLINQEVMVGMARMRM
ncbi:MAG: hypothetical protein AB8F74_15955 [Saprospiraceae bacterium]